jgi:ABC-type arginine transport system permease subunit
MFTFNIIAIALMVMIASLSTMSLTFIEKLSQTSISIKNKKIILP